MREKITVDDYILGFPKYIQEKLVVLRKSIKEAAPNAIEKISWGVPTYNQNGFLVQFAGYKKHIGFYSSPATIAHFKDELTEYKTNTKNTVQFDIDKTLPLDLIRQMVLFRLRENLLQNDITNKLDTF